MNRILFKFLFASTFIFFALSGYSQFWTEDFGAGACNSGQLATAYNGNGNTSNASWTATNGANGNIANIWFVSAEEQGTGLGNCGAGCGGSQNNTLHIGSDPGWAGDGGAAYEIGGGCGFGLCANTDRRMDSPTIDCTGQSNIELSFLYIENGDGTNDNFTIEYFDGTSWTTLTDPAKTPFGSCAPQGMWTSYSTMLPASANGNANVKIGLRWVNNDDGVGTDPSVAIDDIALTSLPPATDPEVQWATASSTENEANLFITNQLTIANPDPSNATTVTVNITSGDLSRLLFWTNPQTFTFPAGSSTPIDVDLFFDDDICQEIDVYTLDITAVVTPTKSPTIGANNPHLFTLVDDEMQYRDSYSEDFETGPLAFSKWITANGDWSASSSSPINGAFSLDYTATSATGSLSSTAIQTLYSSDCINGVQTVWRMNINYPAIPDANNQLAIGLTGAGLPGQEYGYGVFIVENPALAGTQLFGIGRLDNGTPFTTPVFATGMLWSLYAANTVGIEVTRDEVGNWGISLDTDGDGIFNNLVPLTDLGAPTTLGGYDPTYIHMGAMGFALDHNSIANGQLKVDDISVKIHGCKDTYYSQASGNFEGAIWDITPGGGGLNPAVANQFSRFEIQSGHVVTQTDQECILDLAISAGGTYTFSPFPWNLGVHGDFLNFGTFIPVASNVAFGGHGLQIIDGAAEIPFSSLTLANDDGTGLPGTVLIGQDISVSNYILPYSGYLDLDNYNLRLSSSAAGTGAILSLPDNPLYPGFSTQPFLSDVLLTGSGEIIMERHIDADTGTDAYPGGWVGLSTPILGKTVADWNTSLITTGFPGSDFPSYAYPGGVLFNNIIHFDEPSNAWVGATGLGDALGTSDGYFVYMNASAQDVPMQGDINRGDITTALDFSGGAGAGWNLMSNPYPCELDWRLLYANSATNLNPTMYVYDSDARVYRGYNAATSTPFNGGSYVIASSQSFWVQATAAGANLNFTENVKTIEGAAYVFERNEEVAQSLTLTIDNGFTADESILGFTPEATDNYDPQLDGMKMNIPMPQSTVMLISSLSQDDIDLGFNYYNDITEGLEIPVKIKVDGGEYTFGINNIEALPQSACVMVHDLVTDVMIPVTEDFSYTFTSEAFEGVRFQLVFGAPLQIETQAITCNGSNNGAITITNPGDYNYAWYNENEEVIATGTNTIEDLAFGNYTVIGTSANSLCSSVSEVVELDEPQEDEMSFYTLPDLCNSENLGELILDGQQVSGEYSYEISQGENMIEYGIAEGYLLRTLESGIYHVEIVSNCQSFEYDADLRDPNAPQVEILNLQDNVMMEDGIANIQLTADLTNVTNFAWIINDELASNEEDLSYQFTEEGIYTIKLMGIGNSMTCSAIDERTITVSSLVAVDELTNSDINMTLTSAGLVIDSKTKNIDQVQIINTLGQIILDQDLSNTSKTSTLNLEKLSKGAYIVKLLNDEETIYSGKFIK